MNIENIQRVISSLRGEHEPTRDAPFDMSSWSSCIAGRIYMLQTGSINGAHEVIDKLCRSDKRLVIKYIERANSFLELSIEEAAKLFLPNFFHTIDTLFWKEEAIAVLEKLLKTGRVEWNHPLRAEPYNWQV